MSSLLTLPLTVSPLCNLATGALCSRFSSICQAITVMFPTRSLSADLTHRNTKSGQRPRTHIWHANCSVLCLPVT